MNEEKGLLTTTYFGRTSKKGLAFIVSKLQKNESLPHSFFFARKDSKVIFRVTQKSLRILLNYFRKYLALAESSTPIVLLPMVAWLPGLFSNPALYLPMVATVSACPSVGRHSEFHNPKCKCYGKQECLCNSVA